MRRGNIVLGSLLFLLAGVLVSCSAAHRGRPSLSATGDIASRHDAVSVQSDIATKGELTTTHVASGTVVPVTQSNVAARVAGIVKTVDEQAGAWVHRDQIVVELDDSQLKLSVESAQAALDTATVNLRKATAELDLANLTLTRDKSLIKKDLIPQSQVDVDSTNAESAKEDEQAAHAAMDQARVQLKQAELNLRYASIRAPFAGQLAAVNVSAGEFVGENTPVFVLASPDREIDFKVPPGDAAALAKGSSITFSAQGQSYSAYISEAPSTPINGVVPIVARFRLTTSALPYGTVGSVTYRLQLASAVIVPISAIQTTGNVNYVFVIENGTASNRTVAVLAESGTNAAVNGLVSGSRIIVNPPPGLLAGSRVTFDAAEKNNG